MKRPWLNHYDSDVPSSLAYPEITVDILLKRTARKYPDRVCTIYKDAKISYAVIDKLSDAFAAALLEIGLHKGDRVAVIMPNSPQFVLAYFGILKAGGVVVAMNPLYKADELDYHIRESGAFIVVALDQYHQVLKGICPELSECQIILSRLEDARLLKGVGQAPAEIVTEGAKGGSSSLVGLLRKHYGKGLLKADVAPDDPAIFQFSGGTTGIPKAAVGLHRNLVANILQFSHWLVGLEEGQEVLLAAIPLYHVYGMVIGMGMAVALGASMVLIDNARDIEAILRSIDRYQATLFPGVPDLYRAINRHPDVVAGKYNLRSIKACISGSAPLMPETKAQFEKLTGGKLIEGYGLSEAPTATHCNPMYGENRKGSIGLPISDVNCRIVDLETGQCDLKPGEAGELIISGPQIMQGYYNKADETKNAIRDGWLFTGDIAKMDEGGYFYLVGRKKDLIKIGGFQVWPREVEEVLIKHPAVKEVCVAGVPDSEQVEVVKAWVILQTDHVVSSEEIRDWCKERIAAYKCPSLVAFRDTFPRTAVGKLLRRELVREYVENGAK
ncbi:MAG: long-chain fatty acid--CoA ligase [Anaerolineaceae bacterium]|nr:long-chain fatty acid--CoA ligase [Anaerolineaceae bacterium]